MKKKNKISRILNLLFLLILLAACSGDKSISETEQAPLQKIRLPMGYIPNVQYAPFYMAVEKGYFKEVGLEIEFDYSYETNGVALVGANELPFALVSGEQVLLAREQGLPVVFVFAWWQDYPVGIASLKELGISKPEDLKGLRVGIPGLFGASYVGLRAMLDAAGLQEEDIILDSIGFSQVEALITGQEEAVVIYVNNEPLQLAARGYEVNVIPVSDYVELASNGLLTNQQMINEDPELVQRMVNALRKGIEDVIADPQEAYAVTTKYVDGLSSLPEEDQAIQKEILAKSIGFWKAERLGFSRPQAWENMHQVLVKMELISQSLEVKDAYTNQFIP